MLRARIVFLLVFSFCVNMLRARIVSLLLLPQKQKQKKRGFFCYCSARKKSSSALLTQFAYRRHALKLLPLLGAIGLLYAWVLFASILRSPVVSPATIKARSWAGLKSAYR